MADFLRSIEGWQWITAAAIGYAFFKLAEDSVYRYRRRKRQLEELEQNRNVVHSGTAEEHAP